MENLLKNSQWAPGPNGGPKYFSGVGPITFDNICIDGNRTCSTTLKCSEYAQDFYDPLVYVKCKEYLCYSWTIRAIEADYIAFVADFFDCDKNLICCDQCNVTCKVGCEFSRVTSKFKVPCNAVCCRLSILFRGVVTACTYYAPSAYYACN